MKLSKNFLKYFLILSLALFISCFFVIRPASAAKVTIKVTDLGLSEEYVVPNVPIRVRKCKLEIVGDDTSSWQEEVCTEDMGTKTTNDKGEVSFSNLSNGEYKIESAEENRFQLSGKNLNFSIPEDSGKTLTIHATGETSSSTRQGSSSATSPPPPDTSAPECFDTIFGGQLCGKDALKDFIGKVFDWATAIIGAAAALMLIYAGFVYMTSGGNEEKIDHAKQIIFSALAGLALIVLARVLFNTIGVNWL